MFIAFHVYRNNYRRCKMLFYCALQVRVEEPWRSRVIKTNINNIRFFNK